MSLTDPIEIRRTWAENDAKRDKGLAVPDNIKVYNDITYGGYGKLNLLDVYHKNDVMKYQPAIISIHGGGWVYGDKDLYKFYCMDLAERGFTVVNFSYRLAPESRYPAPLEDINNVFMWIKDNYKKYNIDINNLFVVGDSAGAQLASQYMTILTNEDYQKLYDFKVPCEEIKIKAAALNCGIYNVKKIVEDSLDDMFNIYVGEKSKDKKEQLDVLKYVTNNFPPTYIMTSHHDFLQEHAKPMYDFLASLGVKCKHKMYGNKKDEEIVHVFHLNIRLPEAIKCNNDECEFFKEFMVPPSKI